MRARHALAADLPELERAMAQAFIDDPMVRWLVGVDDPAARMDASAASFFRVALAAGLQRGHTYTNGTNEGAAVWAPPDVAIFSDVEGAALAEAMVAQCGEETLGRLMALGELVGAHHPHDEPHFYLLLLGAATPGRGLGGELMQPVLDRCDADGLPAYLESSSGRNVSFYERLGFEVRWEGAPEADGPVLRGMWRAPRLS